MSVVSLTAARMLIMSSVYQQYLAKSLTEKYNYLNVQMDRLVNEANTELEIVHQKLTGRSLVSIAVCPRDCSLLQHIGANNIHRYKNRE